MRWVHLMVALLSVVLAGSGCGAIATSPSWVGGGMAVTGPPVIVVEDEEEPADEEGAAEQISARHILVMHRDSQQRPENVDRTREEALARAKECLGKLREGADFSEMVREYTDEPGGTKRGGDLGRFKRSDMVKDFADVAFALKVGEVSEIVETSYGFHVIKRTR